MGTAVGSSIRVSVGASVGASVGNAVGSSVGKSLEKEENGPGIKDGPPKLKSIDGMDIAWKLWPLWLEPDTSVPVDAENG